jgi:DNA ligase-1
MSKTFSPMLAEQFYDSDKDAQFQITGKIPKGYIVFQGDSGRLKNNKWHFQTTRDTLYRCDISNWFLSVKLDGVRATWIPSKNALISRGGHVIHAPQWFIESFPKNHMLDGELWIPHHTFALVSGIIRRKEPRDEEWEKIQFCTFDIPDEKNKPFFQRTALLKQVVENARAPHLGWIEQHRVKDFQEAYLIYRRLVSNEHEGVVLREPNSKYVYKRTLDMLKWKPILSTEARIIGFNEGSNKFKGKLGTFQVALVSDPTIQFNLSGKMDTPFRSQFVFRNGKLISKPKLPSDIVTLEYMTLSDAGVPRQPVFIGFRQDAF